MSETSNEGGWDSSSSTASASRPVDVLQLLLSEIESDPGAAVFPNLAEAYRRVGQPERAREIAANGLDHAPERMAGRVALGLALLDTGEVDRAREVLSVILEDVDELMALLQQSAPREESRQEERSQGESLADRSFEPEADEGQSRETATPEPLGDEEIEHAFDQAEAQPDEMLNVNDVAAAALREECLDEPEVAFAPSEHPVFATATMADLLESQGDARGAESIRSSLEGADLDGAAAERGAQQHPDPLGAVADEVAEEVIAEAPHMDAAEAPQAAQAAEEDAQVALFESRELGAEAIARKARIISTLESWLENIRRDVA